MATPTPKTPTRAEFDKALVSLKETNTLLRRVTADRADAVLKANEKYRPELERLEAEADKARDIIQQYSNANRESVLPEGAKSVRLNGVLLGWKISPAALACKEGVTWDKALELVQKKLPECVRARPELNKTLLKAYLESTANAKKVAACGLELKREEKFFVETESAA